MTTEILNLFKTIQYYGISDQVFIVPETMKTTLEAMFGCNDNNQNEPAKKGVYVYLNDDTDTFEKEVFHSGFEHFIFTTVNGVTLYIGIPD